MKTRLNDFLSEGRSEQIKLEDFNKYVADNNINTSIPPTIIRMSNNNFWYGYIDPTKFTRKPLERIVSYAIEELECWKGWPKRSKSIIGAVPDKYGDVANVHFFGGNDYAVYPLDKNAPIAVASSQDINTLGTFPEFEQDMNHMSINQFKTQMNINLYKTTLFDFRKSGGENKVENEYGDFDYFCEVADAFVAHYNKYDTPSQSTMCNEFPQLAVMSARVEKYGSFRAYLEHALDPTLNGFKLTTYAELEGSTIDREVWTEATCIMILIY